MDIQPVSRWHSVMNADEKTDRESALVSGTFLARPGGVIDPVKFSSHLVWSPREIWLLFLIPCAHNVRCSKNLGTLRPRPHQMGRDWPPRHTPLPRTCYHDEFGRFRSNRIDVPRGPPKVEEAGAYHFGWGVAKEICPSPHVLSFQIWPF